MQKSESQEVTRKQSRPNFPKKKSRKFFTPKYTHIARNGGNKEIKQAKFSPPKKITSYPLIHTRTNFCVAGTKNVCFFRKIWLALFPCYLYFMIHSFALLPTINDRIKNYFPIFHSWCDSFRSVFFL